MRALLLTIVFALGCTETTNRASNVQVDAAACFRQAVGSECGDAVRTQLREGALTCLRLQTADGPGGTLSFTYDVATGDLAHKAGEVSLSARVGDSLELELYVLRSDAATCPEFHNEPDCGKHDSCLLSFGREQLRVEDEANATLIYGGEDGRRCTPVCDSRCTVERCDGVDNDCDGAIDEDFGIGAACTSPGRCGEGLLECDASGDVVCNSGPGGSAFLGVPETCSGLDDDCDGAVDEDFDVIRERIGADAFFGQTAPEAPNGPLPLGTPCVAAGACGTGAVSCRHDRAVACCGADPGCLGPDHPGASGVEVCDGLDNDCDGKIDEDLTLIDALGNERGLGQGCSFRGLCDDGRVICQRQDLVPCCSTDPACGGAVAGDEQCDGIDNDCDGIVDEGFVDLGDACDGGQTCEGLQGFVSCSADRTATCCTARNATSEDPAEPAKECLPPDFRGAPAPLPCDDPSSHASCPQRERIWGDEVCDALDNDCDGVVDEGFDLQVDPLHCGGCNRPCAPDHALGECVGGSCRIVACQEGWFDEDGRADTGCEYGCAGGVDVQELCNGADDDCDGETDELFDLDDDVDNCGRCGRGCAIDGAIPGCSDGVCFLERCAPGFRNLDGDDGTGCEYECDAESVEDPPDQFGEDANCDGIDGEIENAVFVAEGGDGQGGMDDPIGTIAAGLARARETGATMVLVSLGTYEETVTLVSGIGLHGGYLRALGWVRDPGAHTTRIRGGALAIEANGLRAPTVLSGFHIETGRGAAGADPGDRGGNSIAIRLSDIPPETLTIEDCWITAGPGAPGERGAAGARLLGGGGGGGTGDNAHEGSSDGGNGGASGSSQCGRPGGRGGRGGFPGLASCSENGDGGAAGTGGAAPGGGGSGCEGRGGNGDPGAEGALGRDGAGGAVNGEVADGQWRGFSGESGTEGSAGGGGGGGGGGWGGCCNVACLFCDRDRGAGGGGGGGGGCAGGGAGGGGAGGGAFGVFLVGASPTLRRNEISTGDGGAGGSGGTGANGTGGGGQGSGGNPDESGGPGGTGGSGAAGGRGGHGGGGAGGLSIGVYGVQGSAPIVADDNVFRIGDAGEPGRGDGSPGAAGGSADTQL